MLNRSLGQRILRHTHHLGHTRHALAPHTPCKGAPDWKSIMSDHSLLGKRKAEQLVTPNSAGHKGAAEAVHAAADNGNAVHQVGSTFKVRIC